MTDIPSRPGDAAPCPEPRFPAVPEHRYSERGGRRWLWGGSGDFDVTRCELEPWQLRHGIGREHFAALPAPVFDDPLAADDWLTPDAAVLLVKVGDDARVYPRELLSRHEVVNDVVGGRPLMAAYCVLADLGAAYEREIGGHVFTFAVSGYTAYHPDIWRCRNAFVLWDRDSESLWWPPLGRAVAGPMLGAPLPTLPRALWAQTSWSEAKRAAPAAGVLRPGQDFARPTSWPRWLPETAPTAATADPADASWGANAEPPG